MDEGLLGHVNFNHGKEAFHEKLCCCADYLQDETCSALEGAIQWVRIDEEARTK
jgi:hypothetical protein